MKRKALLLLALVLMLTLVACAKDQPVDVETSETMEVAEVSYPLTIKDGQGQDITIDKEPERVISLAPSVTETIFAIGAGEKVVGRTDYCTYPAEVESIPSVGTILEPDVEAILALEPDLIIAQSIFLEETLEQFNQAGIPVLSIQDPNNLEELYAGISTIGQATAHVKEAQAVLTNMQTKISEVHKAIEGVEPKSVYYAVSFGEYGDFTATGDTFIHEVLTQAGATNAAEEGVNWAFDREQLIAKDPDVVIVADENDNVNAFSSDPAYSVLKAVENGQVIAVDKNLLEIPGPRIGDAVETIAKILYPDKF